MTTSSSLTHAQFTVSPGNLSLLATCIDTLLPWVPYIRRDDLVAYRLSEDPSAGLVILRPTQAAEDLSRIIDRCKRSIPDLDRALNRMATIAAELTDHVGFRVRSLDEWEQLVSGFEHAAVSHPEWQLSVVAPHRPRDPKAPTDRLYQAWLRIGLLGPIHNTLHVQCENPDSGSKATP